MEAPSHIIVVGASAGGLKAISALLAAITNLSDMAVFVVLHVSKNSSGIVITGLLQKNTSLTCHLAQNAQAITAGSVYIAPPECHMVIKHSHIWLVKGPAENRLRPSIDVLFRSAAITYNSKVTGIILSGLSNDGTAGMASIKRCGGLCIVQEPDEAEFEDMPTNVLQQVEVDYQVPIADIGYILDDLFSKPPRPSVTVPDDIVIEANMTENMTSNTDDLEKIGTRSNYTCPECSGSLWMIDKDPIKRYRCFTGHMFTKELLMNEQSEQVEESLWASIRMMEEKKHLLLTTAHNYELIYNNTMAQNKFSEAATIEKHISQLKMLIDTLREAR
ncbi:MAG: chemotaxis protein CheB [Mucilaginibacter sp.]